MLRAGVAPSMAPVSQVEQGFFSRQEGLASVAIHGPIGSETHDVPPWVSPSTWILGDGSMAAPGAVSQLVSTNSSAAAGHEDTAEGGAS